MPEPLTPRSANEAAVNCIKGMILLGTFILQCHPFADEMEELYPDFADKYRGWHESYYEYEARLLPLLGTDDAPQPIVYEGRVYSREGGRLVVTDAPAADSPAAG